MVCGEFRATGHRLVFINKRRDGLYLIFVVPQVGKSSRNCLVDDGHGSAAYQALHLDQTEIWFDSGGVAIHEQADSAGGGQHRGLAVPYSYSLRQSAGLKPVFSTGRNQIFSNPVVKQLGGFTMLIKDLQRGLSVGFKTSEWF